MNQSPMAIRVTDLFNKFGMTNYVSSPTRATTLTESIIDLFLSTCPLTGPCEIAYLDISDHFAVLGNLSVAGFAPGRTSSYRPTRRIHKINWDTFNSDLSVEQASLLAIDDVNTLASSFIASIVSTLDKHAPVRMRRNRDRRPCPWVTDELVACVRERDRLHRLLMKNRCNDDLRSQHRTARAKARKLDRSLKNTYFIQQCQTSDQRKLWSVINTVVGRKKQSHTAQVPISDLSKLFGDVVHDPQRPPQLCSPSGPMAEGAFTDFSVVTVEDVASSLKSVNPFKATGSDQVPSIILQKCYPTIAPTLTRIINISLSSGEFPLSFKLSHVSPLFKSGDPTLPKNYRPVSLLPVISRITEAFVKNQITQYLDSKQLLPPTQFAYRKLHSTEDALTYAVDRWQMARAERKYTGIVFVDMSKAFDRVRHERLVTELFKLGISGTALNWFCSYLSGRTQQIKLQDQLSGTVPCSRGVPQGSVLGPLLFVIYTADVKSTMPPDVADQEFADDIALDCSNACPKQVCESLSSAVTNLAKWLDDIGLLLNAQKTQVLFVKPRGGADVQEHVRCRGQPLEATTSAKYLGVVIDNDLSWQPHISHVTRKIGPVIGQLWRHGRSLSLRARQVWYVSMIQAHLSYGSNCFFSSLSKQLLDKLHRLSKSGVRATLQQRTLVPTAPLLELLGVPSLPQLLFQKLAIFVFKCLNDKTSPLLKNLFVPINDPATPQLRTTRGQVSSLLRVPFLPGPAGRRSIQFVSSILWNALPVAVRTEGDWQTFKALATALDLPSLYPY